MRSFLILVMACSSPTKPSPTPPPAKEPPPQDPCITVVDKLAPMLKRRFRSELTPPERDKAIAKCQAADADERKVIDCIVAAPDDDAMVACMDPKLNPKIQPVPLPELDKIVDNLRAYRVSHQVLLEGNAELTPAKPCCSYPDHKCPAGSWSAEIWKTLGVDNSKSRDHQLRFEGTRKKVVVEAIGDLDCDGTAVSHRRVLEIRDDGDLHVRVIDPKVSDD